MIAADPSDATATAMFLDRTQHMPIALSIAAAGFRSLVDFLARNADEQATIVDLNRRALVMLTNGLATRMAERCRGGIVMFSLVVGFQGVPSSAAYSATKGFVQSFAEGLFVELRTRAISVLSVAPGRVSTGFGSRAGMRIGNAGGAS